jgi:hypothetical protein
VTIDWSADASTNSSRPPAAPIHAPAGNAAAFGWFDTT